MIQETHNMKRYASKSNKQNYNILIGGFKAKFGFRGHNLEITEKTFG